MIWDKIFLLTFTRKGCETVKRIYEGLMAENAGKSIFLCSTESFIEEFAGYPAKIASKDLVENNFCQGNQFIFVCAAGIAVRYIAPFVKSKIQDPGVLVVSEDGGFVIPILSGHLGGGNEMASQVAATTGGRAVITTATDSNEVFAVDVFAKQKGFSISSMSLAKKASARLLEGEELSICGLSESDELPRGLINFEINGDDKPSVAPDICISPIQRYIKLPVEQREKVLYLIPRCVYLGIGCKKGTSFEKLKDFVEEITTKLHIYKEAIAGIASIDIKAKEVGLIELARYYGCDFLTYSSAQLQEISGNVSSSDFVKAVTGVDNVCERAALKASGMQELFLEKTSYEGMTIAICVKK